MSDVTEILLKIEAGDAAAKDKLLPLVYDQLRRVAGSRMIGERLDHTLQATALVHEAYLKLFGAGNGQAWKSRGHFFGAAAEAMRRILVDSARAKQSQKRGGGYQRVDLHDLIEGNTYTPDKVLDLSEGIDGLAGEDAEAAELVKLRCLLGFRSQRRGSFWACLALLHTKTGHSRAHGSPRV